MLRPFLLIGFLLTPSVSALADPIAGQATVIDGDTIEIHGERIRLNGIDAPESGQTCRKADGSPYRCGQVAAFALADWIGRSLVICHPQGEDRYGRTIAACSVRDEDMGRWLVEQGHALAYRRYSQEYVPAEAEAAGRKLGVWQGAFVPPWDWRRGVR